MRNGNMPPSIYQARLDMVLILPMRNGNSFNLPRSFSTIYLFLSYLWGMETKRCKWWWVCGVSVLILPMRNGNLFSSNISEIFFIHSFLSYLWGMETYIRCQETGCLHTCSYPTYEEWKHFLFIYIQDCFIYVLILPMRNGNYALEQSSELSILCSYPTYEEWKQCIREYFLKLFYLFLSYLWGMETSELWAIWISPAWFLSYLWGMETNL